MKSDIILILNRNNKQRVFKNYSYKSIYVDKSIIKCGEPLFIVYEDNTTITDEIVEGVDFFEEDGLKVITANREWFIHQ